MAGKAVQTKVQKIDTVEEEELTVFLESRDTILHKDEAVKKAVELGDLFFGALFKRGPYAGFDAGYVHLHGHASFALSPGGYRVVYSIAFCSIFFNKQMRHRSLQLKHAQKRDAHMSHTPIGKHFGRQRGLAVR